MTAALVLTGLSETRVHLPGDRTAHLRRGDPIPPDTPARELRRLEAHGAFLPPKVRPADYRPPTVAETQQAATDTEALFAAATAYVLDELDAQERDERHRLAATRRALQQLDPAADGIEVSLDASAATRPHARASTPPRPA